MNTLRIASLCMMLLVLTLPAVAAQELRIERFGTQGRPEGFAENGDTVLISALAGIPGEEAIDKTQVRLAEDGLTRLFDECSPAEDNLSRCTYSGIMGQDLFPGTYEILLLSDARDELRSVERNLSLDTLAPVIVQFTVSPRQSTDGSFTLRYHAQDFGRVFGDQENCAGIRIINITDNSTIVAQIPGSERMCDLAGSHDIQLPVQGDLRLATLCAQPIDFMDRAGNQLCVAVSADAKAPVISDLRIESSSGRPLTHSRPGVPTIMDIIVTVTGDPLPGTATSDVSVVNADLSALNPSLGPLPASDRRDNTFAWRRIAITSPQHCQVRVHAEDTLGNAADTTLSCTLGLDSKGPDAIAIVGAPGTRASFPVFPRSATLAMTFEEADDDGLPGAGLHEHEVYLDLSSIGMANHVRARSCEPLGGMLWLCEFPWNPSVGSGRYSISVSALTKDDLGNTLARGLSQDILLDLEPPHNLSLSNMTIIHGARSTGDAILSGDTLEFTVTGTGFSSATADFTEFGGTNASAGRCLIVPAGFGTESSGECVFRTPVSRSGPYDALARFNFMDEAGNVASLDHRIPVLSVDLEENPNHWRVIDVDCSPASIDRSTTTLISHKAYCRISLAPFGSEDQDIVSLRLGALSQCSPAETRDSLTGIALLNSFPGSKEPVIALQLARKEFGNALKFACPLQILSRVGNTITAHPEIENVSITIPFFNQNLGELGKNIDKEVDKEIKKAQNSMRWIGTLDKFAGYAKKMCQIKDLITSLLSLADALLDMAGNVAQTLWPNPATHPVAVKIEALRAAACGGPKTAGEKDYENTFNKIFDKFCSFVNCQHMDPKPAKGLLGLVPQLGGAGIGTICSKIQDGLKDTMTGKLPKGFGLSSFDQFKLSGLDQPVDTKESLVWSLACMCVPGIVHNLNKYRQIQCEYGLCLAREVKEQGLPISYCKDQKEYMTCNFVMNEVFNAIPFTNLYNNIANTLKSMFANPFNAFAAVAGTLCQAACRGSFNKAYKACIMLKTAAKIGDAIGSIKSMIQGEWFNPENDACAQLDRVVEEQKAREAGIGLPENKGILGGLFG